MGAPVPNDMKSCTHLFLSGKHSLGIPSPGDLGVLGTASSEGLASPEGGLPSGNRWQALRSKGGGMGLTFLPDVVRVSVGLDAAAGGADVTAAAAVEWETYDKDDYLDLEVDPEDDLNERVRDSMSLEFFLKMVDFSK